MLAEVEPFLVSKTTNSGRLGKWIAKEISERGVSVANSMGNGPAYTALKAGVSAEKRLQNMTAPGADGEAVGAKRLLVMPRWVNRTDNQRVLETTYLLAAVADAPETPAEPLTVSSKSNAGKLAGAIKARMEQTGEAILTGIGGGPMSQAMKAAMIADTFLKVDGEDTRLALLPMMKKILPADGGNETTVMEVRCVKYSAQS